MVNELYRTIRLAGQRLLGIVVAIPVAVLAGLAAVFVMDTVLPHGKGGSCLPFFLLHLYRQVSPVLLACGLSGHALH
jgi:hypothetical protein